MFDLTGHVALITGGNSGIGLSYAKGLVKCGASVAIWGRNAEKNQAALSGLRELGGNAKSFICDVMDPENIRAAFDKTVEQFGKVDSCFANAGGSGKRGLMSDLETDDWDYIVSLNLTSVVNTYKVMIEHLMGRKAPGKLIVTSSVASRIGIPFGSGYCATKAAVEGLTKSLAIEVGRAGIQVNAILPGFIETEMSLKTPQHFQDSAKRRAASGQIGTLEDMEGIAVYLASPHSNFMTGQSLILDGGHTIFPM